jgi:FkbM family methyltransferase
MSELVFDVGMHNGNDTAYYLAKGYDVVAIDANPEFCADASKRFAAEVDLGRLTICNVGIAEQPGELTFWVSNRSEWSSFYKDNATKGGESATPLLVPTVRFGDLLSKHATPFCVKIDIEGNDTLCLHELERSSALPTYVSFEGSDGTAADLEFLMKLGYNSFKCVRQNDWREITPDNMLWQGRVRKFLAGSAKFGVGPPLRFMHYRKPRTSGWKFKVGSSGPLPNEYPGRWLNGDEIHAVREHLETVDHQLNAGGLGEWHDFHAYRS